MYGHVSRLLNLQKYLAYYLACALSHIASYGAGTTVIRLQEVAPEMTKLRDLVCLRPECWADTVT